MTTSPTTAKHFAAMISDARERGEAPIASAIPTTAIRTESDGKRFRIVATTSDGTTKRLSSWQSSEERAVHDAIARTFC